MIDLTGHILNKVEFNEEEQTLSITVDNDKIFLLKVDGDCCSSGKFLGTSPGHYLSLPQKIVGNNYRGESFKDGEYKVYEETLILEDGGEFTITYDNESNGYYGGSLDAYYNGEKVWGFPAEATK